MTINEVPSFTIDQTELDLPRVQNPFNSIWWSEQTVGLAPSAGVPESVMGWMVAQGWQVTGVRQDTSTVPATTTYSLKRDVLKPIDVLAALCNSYTIAANEARDANETRYQEVVADWKDMVSNSQTQFAAQVTEQNAFAATYLADLDTYMDAIDALITSNANEMDAALLKAEAEINQGQPEHDAYEAQAEAILTLLSSDYTTHSAAAQALISTLGSTTRATITSLETLTRAEISTLDTTTTNLLTGLYTTETARVNAAFAATLAAQIQDLTDRGLYTGTMPTDLAARNTRDRDEELQRIQDRINVQQVENEHRLATTYVGNEHNLANADNSNEHRLADASLADQHRLYTQQTALRNTTLAVRERLYQFAVDLLKYRAAIAMQNAQAMTENRNRAIVSSMQVATTRLEGWKTVSAENQRLLAYQLDERNKLLVGLFGFVERRDDIGPSWADMNSLIAGLGDNGGGWIQP